MSGLKKVSDIQAKDVAIYSTKDYDRFNFISGNRPVDLKRVDKISGSIKNKVDYLRFNPIMVNADYGIIDGQHRFTVSKKLKRPVYYIIVESGGVDSISSINSNTKNWSIGDYLTWYVKNKYTEYINLKKFSDNNRIINLGNTIALLSLNDIQRRKESLDLYKTGAFKIEHWDHVLNLCNALVDIKPYSQAMGRPLIVAMDKIIKKGVYDHSKLVVQLKRNGTIEAKANVKEYLREIEEIYNLRLRTRINIY